MFISPKHLSYDKLVITKNTAFNVESCDFKKYITECLDTLRRDSSDCGECKRLDFILGIPDSVKA